MKLQHYFLRRATCTYYIVYLINYPPHNFSLNLSNHHINNTTISRHLRPRGSLLAAPLGTRPVLPPREGGVGLPHLGLSGHSPDHLHRQEVRRRRHPSRIRIPFRVARVCPGLRRQWHHLRRPHRRQPQHLLGQDQRPSGRHRGRRPRRSWFRRCTQVCRGGSGLCG